MRGILEQPSEHLAHRRYLASECACFSKTKEKFGGLSNMASGYPLVVSGIRCRTSEALYQACRFPAHVEVQREVLRQNSPMTAKMVARRSLHLSRPDWPAIRTRVMRWVLRIKLAQHWESFSALLVSTEDRAIVEISRRDQFWGAKWEAGGEVLVGTNVLGRLLMEIRSTLEGSAQQDLRTVQPLAVSDALLLGRRVERCVGPAAVELDP